MIDHAGPEEAAIAADLAFGARLRSYRFDKYRTKEKPEQKPTLEELTILVEDPAAAKRAFQPLEKVAEAVFFSRDLISEPANVIYPETLAEAARALEKLGVEVEVLDEKQMKKLGMNALLGVGQGSVRPPRLVVMQWQGNAKAKNAAPLAFIGKGVTFDTGGISIKSAGGMEDMKWDMAGAGVVIGLMRALAAPQGQGQRGRHRRAGREHAVGHGAAPRRHRHLDVGPDHRGHQHRCRGPARARRRALVLPAPLQAAAHDRSRDPHRRDHRRARQRACRAFLPTTTSWPSAFSRPGTAVGEKLWRMPLAEAYDKLIDSDAADMKNIGGREAGSITAAQFLQRFVDRTCRGPISTSPARPGRRRMPPPCPRARPPSACACSTASSPSITRRAP